MAQSIDALGPRTPVAAPPLTGGAKPLGSDGIGGKDAFLQLLVAQIKNQDPLNPADGTQFVTQLAQFSELEQLLDIRQILDNRLASLESLQQQALSEPAAEPVIAQE